MSAQGGVLTDDERRLLKVHRAIWDADDFIGRVVITKWVGIGEEVARSLVEKGFVEKVGDGATGPVVQITNAGLKALDGVK